MINFEAYEFDFLQSMVQRFGSRTGGQGASPTEVGYCSSILLKMRTNRAAVNLTTEENNFLQSFLNSYLNGTGQLQADVDVTARINQMPRVLTIGNGILRKLRTDASA